MPSDESIEKSEPHYDLCAVKAAFANGEYRFTGRVDQHLRLKGWTDADVIDVIFGLACGDFHKSQAHRQRPNAWLDIYRPRRSSGRLYVKFTEGHEGTGFVVMSFCRDGDAH
ncbi:MAG: type II toxin-antitoxin system MqsR family toxin [Coriobacteriia bacterium]|nr:type II toxin-antitoxin system MqsR family toxin [Coriobacteriia bacterium]